MSRPSHVTPPVTRRVALRAPSIGFGRRQSLAKRSTGRSIGSKTIRLVMVSVCPGKRRGRFTCRGALHDHRGGEASSALALGLPACFQTPILQGDEQPHSARRIPDSRAPTLPLAEGFPDTMLRQAPLAKRWVSGNACHRKVRPTSGQRACSRARTQCMCPRARVWSGQRDCSESRTQCKSLLST